MSKDLTRLKLSQHHQWLTLFVVTTLMLTLGCRA